MRSLIAIAILGTLWNGAVSAARAEVSVIDVISFSARVDAKTGNLIAGGPAYVGFEEELELEPSTQELDWPYGLTDIHVEMPMELLFTEFLNTSDSRGKELHRFRLKPFSYGDVTLRFDASYVGQSQTVFSKTYPIEVRHCLNGVWRDERGPMFWQDEWPDELRTLEICQTGDDVKAWVKDGPKLCGEEETAFTAKLEGEELKNGKMTVCTPTRCQKFAEDNRGGVDDPGQKVFKNIDFKGTVWADGLGIAGKFKLLRFKVDSKGKPLKTFCKRQKFNNPWMPVSFRRITFGHRCGAPCRAPSEQLPPVSVPGLEE